MEPRCAFLNFWIPTGITPKCNGITGDLSDWTSGRISFLWKRWKSINKYILRLKNSNTNLCISHPTKTITSSDLTLEVAATFHHLRCLGRVPIRRMEELLFEKMHTLHLHGGQESPLMVSWGSPESCKKPGSPSDNVDWNLTYSTSEDCPGISAEKAIRLGQ